MRARLAAAIRQRYEACYRDPAEIRLLEILGGITLTIGSLKRNGRTFTLVLSEGYLLKSEHFRKVANDNRAVLFMNDIDQVLVIQKYDYQHDVVKYQELEDELLGRGLRVRYIPQSWLDYNPAKAVMSVKQFIYN